MPLTSPPPDLDPGPDPDTWSFPRRCWQTAGLLAVAHVALFVAAAALIGPPRAPAGRSAVLEHSWVETATPRVMTGGYLLLLGFCGLLVVMAFLVRAVGRRTPAGRWASATAAASGAVYVVTIVAGGFAPGAAAMWARGQEVDLVTLLTVNDIRNFAYFIALPVMGVFALALGIAALADRVLTRWAGWGGIAVGVALLLAIPAAAYGVQYGQPLWLLWWLGLGVGLLRHGREPRLRQATTGTTTGAPRPAASDHTTPHSGPHPSPQRSTR